MANVKYRHIMDRDLIYNMLIQQGLSMDTAADILSVPYNCLLNQAKKLLTCEELKLVVRKRKTYTLKEKKKILAKVENSTFEEVSATLGIHEAQLRNWKRRYVS